jgi:hypothetical protein
LKEEFEDTKEVIGIRKSKKNLKFLVFNATFSNIMATSLSGGGSRSTRREPPTLG